MTIDIAGILIGAGITSTIGAIAFFAKRIIAQDAKRERATLFSNYTEIAARLSANGMTVEEVDSIGTLIEARKKKQRTLEDIGPTAVSPYWTQSAMNIRAAGSAEIADSKMNSAIAELKSILSPEENSLLEEAQAAWSYYRERHEDFVAHQVNGGTLEPLIRASERETQTLQRLKTIQALIDERKNRAA